MKKYKFSSQQLSVINLTKNYVSFSRGRGATLAIIYGAFKYARKNKNSSVLVCADSGPHVDLLGERLGEIINGSWWLSKIVIKKREKRGSNILVTLRNKSTILLTPVGNIGRGYGFYDLAYFDKHWVGDRDLELIPSIAGKYCVAVGGYSRNDPKILEKCGYDM